MDQPWLERGFNLYFLQFVGGRWGGDTQGQLKKPRWLSWCWYSRCCLNNPMGTISGKLGLVWPGAWGGCLLSLAHLHQQHLRKLLWLSGETAPAELLCAGRISSLQESLRLRHKNGAEPTWLHHCRGCFLVSYSSQVKAAFWSKSLSPKSIKSPSDDG